MHTGQVTDRPTHVVAVSANVVQCLRGSAKLGNLRRHAQQIGEGVIPCGDVTAVGILQVIADKQGIGVVAGGVLTHDVSGYHARVQLEPAYFAVPLHQVVAVDQVANVDVARAVAPHGGEELAVHRHGRSHDQFFIVVGQGFEGSLFRGFRALFCLCRCFDLRSCLRRRLCPWQLQCSGFYRCCQHHKRQQAGQNFFHSLFLHQFKINGFFAGCAVSRAADLFRFTRIYRRR